VAPAHAAAPPSARVLLTSAEALVKHRSRHFPARRRLHRFLTAALPLVLLTTLADQLPARAEAAAPLKPQQEHSVPGRSGVDIPAPPADPVVAAAEKTENAPAPVWPAAGSSVIDLSSPPPSQAAVRLTRSATKGKAAIAASAPHQIRLQILDRDAADNAHQPVVMRVGSADDVASAGPVNVSLDYSGFRTAFGADWATRLRLVQLPECALTTPDAPACQPVPLASSNDAVNQTVTADVSLPAAPSPTAKSAVAASAAPTVLLAATAAPAGATGDYTATKLAPSASWQAGGSSGDFSWSYPMRVPPSPAGPQPEVTLTYSAQSVDGHTAVSNNQPSWVGEGFDYNPGSISRAYLPCQDDMGGKANNSTKTGDLCWSTDNAALSLSGHSGELVRDDDSGGFRLKNDDGTRVQKLTGAANGAHDGEYWKITTPDGTQYFFGLNRLTGWSADKAVTNSTWTAPLFGNNPDEPCHKDAFADSYCDQAWQWNLDYVVDTHGNTMSFWYTPEHNHYARAGKTTTVSDYIRGGYLTRIDYGTDNRSGTDTEYTGTPAAQVQFTPADRCSSTTNCDLQHPTNWPDTPLDQYCASTTSCPSSLSPTFWTQKRLDSVKTRVSTGPKAYKDVEQWTLHQSYPDPGDATRAGLWLERISHTGLVGGKLDLPDISFVGYQLPNRVNLADPKAPKMNWWRISYIKSESGGIVGVTYKKQECIWGSHMPANPESNTMRCFPAFWTRDGALTPTIDWFNKYVVDEVTETDTTGGSPRVITHYDYPNAPAWHYADDNGAVRTSHLSWSDWRGYDQVNATQGDPGSQTYTETRFFRGMDGDHLPSGTRDVSVDGISDDDAFAGMTREETTYNGPKGPEVSETAYTPWESKPTSTRTLHGITEQARHTGVAVTKTRTDLDGGRPARTTTSTVTFEDTYGHPTQIADGGDDATSADDRCTINTYAPNTGDWITGDVVRTQVYALPCGKAAKSEADVVSDTRTYYDQQSFGTAPTQGDVTQTDIAQEWSTSGITWLTNTKAKFDAAGRVTDAWDVRGNHTGTAYSPATGPVTTVTSTTSRGWTSTRELDPAWGLATATTDVNDQRTELAYDPVGRLIGVWLPNRDHSAGDTANTTYEYSISNTGITSTTTSTLGPNGTYIKSYTLYDSLLRPRQIQAPSATGKGRVLTDTLYDTAGRVVKTNNAYYNEDSGPGKTLFTAQDNQVASQSVTVYDGTGRVTSDILMSDGVERTRTTTAYGGDHTDVTPPAGGTPTTSVFDARGQKTELRQYHGTTPTGAYDSTKYTYDGKGQLTRLTDASGNAWTRAYDLLGRTITNTDPDAGVTTSSFNAAGDLLTVKDGRDKTTAYRYDDLGRQTGEFENNLDGKQLAAWSYDDTLMPDGVTKAKGRPSTITKYVGTDAYTFTTRGYTSSYQATGQNVTIPPAEGALAGTYVFTSTFNVNGSVNTMRIPSAGDVGAETLTYSYDATTGRLDTLKTNFGGTTSTYVTDTQYTPMAEPTVTSYSTGGKMFQRGLYYDPATRRANEVVAAKETAPTTISDAHYTYDAAGNVTKIADTPTGGQSDVQCLTNDFGGRLTQAWTPGNGDCDQQPSAEAMGGPAPYWQTWTIDRAGNRLDQTDHATATGDVSTTYDYPAEGTSQAHTVRSTSTTDATGTHTASYVYDAAGNTTSRPGPHGQQTLTWDDSGHLDTVTDASGVNSYIYTPTGDRLLSHDPTGTTLTLNSLELRLTKATGAVSATHFLTFNGETFAQRTSGGVTWLSADLQGTAQIAVDATTQNVVQRRATPYGGSRGPGTTWGNDKGFVGGTDDPTGLVHEGLREYDPATGRFISPDLVIQTGDPQQIGGYSYAANSPVTRSDPSGAWGFSLRGLTDTLKAVNNGATWAGIGMMVLGGMADVGGGLLIASGVGAPLGVALEVVGTDAIIAGATTAAAGITAGCAMNVMHNVSDGGGRGGGGSPSEPSKPPIRDEDVQSLMKEHNGKDNGNPLAEVNARHALEAPDGATSTRVAGETGEGADVTFTDQNGNVVLRREVKTIKGSYNSFDQNLAKGAKQVEGDGEVEIQGEISPAQFEEYLTKFRRLVNSRRQTAKYRNVRVRVRNSRGEDVGESSVLPSTGTGTSGGSGGGSNLIWIPGHSPSVY
jgi:RHS repeat-associated protein